MLIQIQNATDLTQIHSKQQFYSETKKTARYEIVAPARRYSSGAGGEITKCWTIGEIPSIAKKFGTTRTDRTGIIAASRQFQCARGRLARMTDQVQFNIFETTVRLRMPRSIHDDSRNKNVRTDEEEEITEIGESSASENRLQVAKNGVESKIKETD